VSTGLMRLPLTEDGGQSPDSVVWSWPMRLRNFRGDGGSGPPLFGEGDGPPHFLRPLGWFQNIISPKHYVYQRSIVKASKIALW